MGCTAGGEPKGGSGGGADCLLNDPTSSYLLHIGPGVPCGEDPLGHDLHPHYTNSQMRLMAGAELSLQISRERWAMNNPPKKKRWWHRFWPFS